MGSEDFQGEKKSLEECANSCLGTSELFIYGTTVLDSIWNRCSSFGCNCYCELPSGGKCTPKQHDGFKLYTYGSVNKGIDKVLVIE